jgi:beclin 1
MYCQECRTPLKLDGSLNELNPAAFKLLAGEQPLSGRNEVFLNTKQSQPAVQTSKTEHHHNMADQPSQPSGVKNTTASPAPQKHQLSNEP